MSDEQNPKIQIDEEWKDQVQAEKAKLEAAADEAPPDRHALPPASLATLISNFATQALVSLGSIPDPSTGKPVVDLELARFAIDSIGVIEEKTRGNLEAPEQKMVENTLHELRMAYLEASRNPAAMTADEPAEAPESQSRIITP